ncbi:hypothetical protein QQF64_033838 [Cirrhinus molitorella]|uniref:Uncharacterized protein n=1 Tax=Cirrhinus molitorella TaxID=172907 RepID=A0ABR3MV11_9TELE
MGWQLSDFRFDIKYRPGKVNVDADIISRCHWTSTSTLQGAQKSSEIIKPHGRALGLPNKKMLLGRCLNQAQEDQLENDAGEVLGS